MLTVDEIRKGRTLAEAEGMTAEIGGAVALLASEALERDRLAVAREILEGLLAANPRDAVGWALLSAVFRRQGEPEAARLCAEAAARLAPADPRVRLARAEALLACGERARGRAEVEALAGEAGGAGDRARRLLSAMGRALATPAEGWGPPDLRPVPPRRAP